MVTSRLAKREQSRIVKQTALFGGLAVVILLLFFFVLLPQVIKFATGGDNGPIKTDDTIPPQVPIVSSPVVATNSATLPLRGVGEPKSEVVVIVNSQELEHVTIGDDGEFSVDVPLSEGENAITLHGVDEAGNESLKSQTYQITLDTEKPSIVVEQPQPGQVIELRKNQLTEIKGTTEAKAQVYINDRLTYANAAGAFSMTYQLQEGENKLLIKVIDAAGNQEQTELVVTFRL